MDMHEMSCRITFIEEALGTCAANKDIHRDYIASNAPDAKSREEEVEAIGIDGVVEKSMSVFPRLEDGSPFIWDYQWKGFFKSACSMLTRAGYGKSATTRAHKKIIDGVIFVEPRKIILLLPAGKQISHCSRPLRGNGPQGERVALATSETVPSGTTCNIKIVSLDDKLFPLVREWLDYGKYHGTMQWRNSGKGRFVWEEIK